MELAVVAPSVNPELAERFTAHILRDEERYGVETLGHYNSNIERMAPDGRSAVRSLLEQGYYLFDAVLRNADIEQRAMGDSSGRSVPGTVLDASRVNELRERFTSLMVDNLRDRGRNVLVAACRSEVDIDTDFKTPEGGPLLGELRDGKGTTIYGWTESSRPFNPNGHLTTHEDIEYIVDDVGKFARAALAQINR